MQNNIGTYLMTLSKSNLKLFNQYKSFFENELGGTYTLTEVEGVNGSKVQTYKFTKK